MAREDCSVSRRRLRDTGAGPRDARASFRRPFRAPLPSPFRLGSTSGRWNQSRRRLLGCDPGAGACGARCDSCARSAPHSRRAGLHPGSPGAFPPADRARRIPARRRTGKGSAPHRLQEGARALVPFSGCVGGAGNFLHVVSAEKMHRRISGTKGTVNPHSSTF